MNVSGVTFPTQTQLGNIFVPGEKVEIQATIADTSSNSVDWVVTDYHGDQVDNGEDTVVDGKVTINPKTKALGYYLIKITAKSAAGAKGGDGFTTYAIISPLDNSKMTDARFGVDGQIGEKMTTTELAPLLAKLGIAHIRDGLAWGWIEKEKGHFHFDENDFINRMADLQKNNITPLLLICFGNPLYFDNPNIPSQTAAPHTPDQYQAFTRMTLETLKQFGSQVPAIEIWNEYNGSFCQGPAADNRPKYYTEMLKDTYTAVKAEHPDVQVIGGAMVKIPIPYCEKLFKEGALDYMDGIAIHPYEPNPEAIEPQIRQLVDLMKKYNKGVVKPIWVTEYGTWDDKSLDRADAANYMLKMTTVLLAQPEVARAYWFVARDYQEFTNEGLIHSDTSPMGKYTPVVGCPTYATIAKELYKADPKGREAVDPRTRAYHFVRNGQGVWVCWSIVQTANLLFQTNAPLHQINLVGDEKQLTPVNGQINVKADGEPFYIVADKDASVTSVSEVPRSDQVVADSNTGFSDQQGKDGWSYAWYTSNKDGSDAYRPDDVQPMKWTPSPGDWSDAWSGPGDWFQVSESGAQPWATNEAQLWAIRRWTSTYGGQLHVVGDVTRGDPNGDGIGCKIFVDGKEAYSQMIPPKGHETIDTNLTVQKGSKVDFAITPGPGTDMNYDSSGFRVTLLTPSK